jgi:hypothetical protein
MESDNGCLHHWVIDSAEGPVSWGKCKLCQLVREFKNFISEDKWSYFWLRSNADSLNSGNLPESSGL